MPEPGMKQYLIDELNKSIDEQERQNRVITALGSALLDQHELRALLALYRHLVAGLLAALTDADRREWPRDIEAIEALQARTRAVLKGDIPR